MFKILWMGIKMMREKNSSTSMHLDVATRCSTDIKWVTEVRVKRENTRWITEAFQFKIPKLRDESQFNWSKWWTNNTAWHSEQHSAAVTVFNVQYHSEDYCFHSQSVISKHFHRIFCCVFCASLSNSVTCVVWICAVPLHFCCRVLLVFLYGVELLPLSFIKMKTFLLWIKWVLFNLYLI